MRVKEAMHLPVKTIAPDRTVAEAGDLMEQFGIEHLVVMQGRKIIGLISDDDMCRTGGETLVKKAMSPRVVTIGLEESISRAANLMRGHSVDSLVVTDDDSNLAGIITTTDLLEVIGRIGHPERMTLRDRGPRRRRARI